MVLTLLVVSVMSILLFIIISNEKSRLNWLSICNILSCCCVYFIGTTYEIFVFVIVLLNFLFTYYSLFNKSQYDGGDFLPMIGSFRKFVDHEVFIEMSKRYFEKVEKVESYSKKIKNAVRVFNLISFALLILITILDQHGR